MRVGGRRGVDAPYQLALAMPHRAVPALSRDPFEAVQQEVPAQGRDSRGMGFNQCNSISPAATAPFLEHRDDLGVGDDFTTIRLSEPRPDMRDLRVRSSRDIRREPPR